jgi:tetratricopeptide (TPR) repeat protein
MITDRDLFNRAVEQSKEALGIFDSMSDLPSQCKVCYNLGLLECYGGNSDKALEYFNESVKIAHEVKDDLYIALSLFNIGRITNDGEKLMLSCDYAKKTQNEKVANEIRDNLRLLGFDKLI